MNIAKLQKTLPWGAHNYSKQFMARTEPHRDFAHALLHIHRAIGKLAMIAAGGGSISDVKRHLAGKYLADIVICVARAANTYPGSPLALVQPKMTWGGGIYDAVVELSISCVPLDGLVDTLEHEENVEELAYYARGDTAVAMSLMVALAEIAGASVRIGLWDAVDARLAEKFPPQATSAT